MEPLLGPHEQVEAFFRNYRLEGSKEILWSWLKATVTENYHRLSHVERQNVITFYEELSQLIEAVWELHQQQQLLTPDHPKGGPYV